MSEVKAFCASATAWPQCVRVLIVGSVAVALVVLGATPVRVLLVAAVVSMALPLPLPRSPHGAADGRRGEKR